MPVVIPLAAAGTIRVGNLAGEALAIADPGTVVAVFSDGAADVAVQGYYVDVP